MHKVPSLSPTMRYHVACACLFLRRLGERCQRTCVFVTSDGAWRTQAMFLAALPAIHVPRQSSIRPTRLLQLIFYHTICSLETDGCSVGLMPRTLPWTELPALDAAGDTIDEWRQQVTTQVEALWNRNMFITAPSTCCAGSWEKVRD